MSSSESSSEPSSPPPRTRKRKQEETESSSDSDGSINASDNEEVLPSSDKNVLSHAEQRRQKKKQRKSLDASNPPSKKLKLNDGSAALPDSNLTLTPTISKGVKPKRQNSIWVGNLSFWTTRDALKGFFDGVGEITRIHMPTKRGKKGENMGFAYVDLATPDAKASAIALSEGRLEGRNLLIKDGNDFNGRPALEIPEGATQTNPVAGTKASSTGLTKTAQKILRMQKQAPAPTLFLGNLGFDTTERSIRQLFEAHRHYKIGGEKGKGKDVDIKEEDQDHEKSKNLWIRKVRMGTFEDSGACKGFAFVDFTSIEYATNALVNPLNHRLNGRELVVEYASPDAVRRGGGGPRNATQDRSGEGGPRHVRQDRSDGGGRIEKRAYEHTPKRPFQQPVKQEDHGDATKVEAEENLSTTPYLQRPNRGGQDRSHRGRARPGAALAEASRQSAAIVPSQGQKIVF
ncbi:hypothetical protein PAXRUDRAFT_824116 [Paxillus rubicundulus Ve08.2h10]|uniref:RRM domain-containing protein n=1 Tax=Paxillus rubicundulus Ve08.2h10 TaxID=930991 RepID=A0A0D0E2G4_9AGAM|nr:hypothetical protein PAXRUDRAFT_824116 [Paxillus rubicundulus Ve08.2h10]